jgi:uncharacterized protein YbbK (DUF523 family)
LLVVQVGFDDGHKRSDFLIDTLSRSVEFIPVCPELDMRLGVPCEVQQFDEENGSRTSGTVCFALRHAY